MLEEEGGVHMSGGNGGDVQFRLRVEGPFSPALRSSDDSTSLTLQPSSNPTARSVKLLGEVAEEWGGGQRAGETGRILISLEIKRESELWFRGRLWTVL